MSGVSPIPNERPPSFRAPARAKKFISLRQLDPSFTTESLSLLGFPPNSPIPFAPITFTAERNARLMRS